MGVVNLLSQALTNQQSTTPPVLNQPAFTGAGDWTALGVITNGASDSAGSTYRYFQLPSNAIVFDIAMMNTTDNTSGTSYEVGLYAPFGGAVITNCVACLVPAGLSQVTTRTVWTSIFYPAITSGSASSANVGLTLWQLAGLSADPVTIYEVVMTAVTPGTVGIAVALKINWTR